MYSKEERKAIKTAFWRSFKSEMNTVPSSTGKRINWINYPTKLKILYARCEVDENGALFSIDIQTKDPGIREIVWEQFQELKMVLETEVGSPGTWLDENFNAAGQPIKSVVWKLDGVNIYRGEDTSKIFTFLKEKLVGFDAFYQEYNEILFNLIK
jgi:hypothetical protein